MILKKCSDEGNEVVEDEKIIKKVPKSSNQFRGRLQSSFSLKKSFKLNSESFFYCFQTKEANLIKVHDLFCENSLSQMSACNGVLHGT